SQRKRLHRHLSAGSDQLRLLDGFPHRRPLLLQMGSADRDQLDNTGELRRELQRRPLRCGILQERSCRGHPRLCRGMAQSRRPRDSNGHPRGHLHARGLELVLDYGHDSAFPRPEEIHLELRLLVLRSGVHLERRLWEHARIRSRVGEPDPSLDSHGQRRYTSNCASSNSGLAYTSNVVSRNTLAFALGWYNQSPPSTPTDTLGDTFTLGVSNSVTGAAPALVQKAYTSDCNSSSCGLAFTSNVASGNVLAFALGWYNQSPPSTPTDTRGNTFTLGVQNSVLVGGGGSLALDGSAFNIASATRVSASLTTTNANDVIYVMVTTDVGTINTPTATGLTFSFRKSVAAA